MVEFDNLYTIEQVGVWWASHQHTFSVDLSIDGNNWITVIPSRISANSEGSTPVYELFPITPMLAKYIRINIETTSAPSSHIFQSSVAELEAYMMPPTGINDICIEVPNFYKLHPNYPNPFNPVTTISYDLPERRAVNLAIFDLLGREVLTLENGVVEPGYHTMQWDGLDNAGQPVAAGVYLYRLKAGDFTQMRKMVLMK